MSVLSYLKDTSERLVLSPVEKDSIEKSITALSDRLNMYFEGQIEKQLRFGSSTRGTILPRKADAQSDIDYMIVFDNEGEYAPQTFINRLSRFAKYYYIYSQIKQSHPTVVLELNHIKFDLVPAYEEEGLIFMSDKLYIPAPKSEFPDWIETNPNDFNETLTDKNKSNYNLIKPMIRLVKYWNANSNYVFDSFELEEDLVDTTFWWWSHSNLKDYFFYAMKHLPTSDLPQYKMDMVERAEQIIEKIEEYEEDELYSLAEIEIKKLIPEF